MNRPPISRLSTWTRGQTQAILAAIVSLVALAASAHSAGPTAPTLGQPGDSLTAATVTVPRAQQYDFTARTNGQKYRLMISTPARLEPGKRYPILYILDAYWYFVPAALTVPASDADHLSSAIVAGIGYPTDEMDELLRRRTFDLTPPRVAGAETPVDPSTGGVDTFIRMLREEIKPFVQSRYPVDEKRQAIFGMSHGGLAALRILFRHPETFQTYIAGSPAIFQNNRAILADEAAFSKKVRSGAVSLKLLITSAGNEQYRGSDPKLLADDPRFVDDASELATRLSSLDPAKVSVVRTIFPDESHKSVSLATLSRALYFALQPAATIPP